MRWFLLVALVGCGDPPRCLIWRDSIEVNGGTASCDEVEGAFASAVASLRSVIPVHVPSGRIDFAETEAVAGPDGEVVNGRSGCFPFVMKLGTRPWGESSLAHELAHWATSLETGDLDCNFHDGAEGHAGWEERGISDAIRSWRRRHD
jgi:hypothetical protein